MSLRIGHLVAVLAVVAASGCTSSGTTNQNSAGDSFQARPLIMPAQRATTVHADPFGALRVPTSEPAYGRLSRARRDGLANALRAVDCAHPPQLSDGPDRVVCDAGSDVFLLGAPLFTGSDVKDAKALPPSAGVAGWQILLSLTSAAGERVATWTSQHHVASQSGAFNDVQVTSEPPCGPTTSTPCSAFTAYISDGVVRTVPVTFPPFAVVKNTVVINGEFDQAFAVRLAHELAA
jgi:hypothetical protein